MEHHFKLALGLLSLMQYSWTLSGFDAELTHSQMIFTNYSTVFDASNLRVRKINRTQHVIIGSVEIYDDLGDDYEFFSELYKMSGNIYKRLPYKYGPAKFCKYVEEERIFLEGVRKVTNFPPKGTCPWPKGKLQFKGYVLNINNVPPVFNSGNYKLELMLMKNGSMINSYQVFVRVFNLL